MLISHTLLVPHLPTLMIDDQRGHHAGMVNAMREASQRLFDEMPQALVVVSARWGAPGPFMVDAADHHDLPVAFGGYNVGGRYRGPGHPALAKALVKAGTTAGLRVAALTRRLDTGIAVPMHFLVPSRDLPVVPLSIVNQSREDCRRWGGAIRGALEAWPERAAFIVSGLLTFNLHAWTLHRDVPEGLDFDQRTLDALKEGRWSGLADYDERTLERIQPEARLRHLEVLRGFLGEDVPGIVRCYESSAGVGAALIEFPVPGPSTPVPRAEDAADVAVPRAADTATPEPEPRGDPS
jgi:aromatic ring-opening dioxygenase catalytic subunit (LigB family)